VLARLLKRRPALLFDCSVDKLVEGLGFYMGESILECWFQAIAESLLLLGLRGDFISCVAG
jgi:hypothetical protein